MSIDDPSRDSACPLPKISKYSVSDNIYIYIDRLRYRSNVVDNVH